MSDTLNTLIARIRFHQAEWEPTYGQPNYAPYLALAIQSADALEALRAENAALQEQVDDLKEELTNARENY